MTSAAPSLPLATLLGTMTRSPGRPRLTWYGSDDERIELSGHVLDNWVTKTTNLLVEEFGAGPGTRVLVDLPVHWRAVLWAFAVWRSGACVVLPGGHDVDGCDVVVTSEPARHTGRGPEVVAVALGALARRFEGDLPAGAIDAAGAVMTYGDVLTWLPEADTRREALVLPDRTVTHGELLTWAVGDGRPQVGDRTLLLPEDLVELLGEALAVYAADGSVVLCSPQQGTLVAADPDRQRRLVEAERITRV